MTHYRVGQIWADPADERGFSRHGYRVTAINPLAIRLWGPVDGDLSQDELDGLSDEQREQRFPRLVYQPEATLDEIRAGLVGRTIVDVALASIPSRSMFEDGDMSLILDDGNTVRISAWGHDAWGVLVHFDTIPIREEQQCAS